MNAIAITPFLQVFAWLAELCQMPLSQVVNLWRPSKVR